ncbi:MAG: hypothetical protein IJM46_15495, partial [Oscillospiraceae bacterium]|nr:hypothetical protein [Oscillospiraceae bacterium]
GPLFDKKFNGYNTKKADKTPHEDKNGAGHCPDHFLTKSSMGTIRKKQTKRCMRIKTEPGTARTTF